MKEEQINDIMDSLHSSAPDYETVREALQTPKFRVTQYRQGVNQCNRDLNELVEDALRFNAPVLLLINGEYYDVVKQ